MIEIVVSYSEFIRKFQTALQSGCTVLHLPGNMWWFQVSQILASTGVFSSSLLLSSLALVDVESQLTMVLFCISVIISDEHISCAYLLFSLAVLHTSLCFDFPTHMLVTGALGVYLARKREEDSLCILGDAENYFDIDIENGKVCHSSIGWYNIELSH